MTSLVMLAGASALTGCASQVPTTAEWATSKGFQRVELDGKSYFCREQPVAARSDRSSTTCLTLGQLMVARWNGPAAAEGFANPVPAPEASPYYLSNTVIDAALSR